MSSLRSTGYLALALILAPLAMSHAQKNAPSRPPQAISSPRTRSQGAVHPTVRVMPGYPNAPHYLPDERKLVQDGLTTVVWGNVSVEGGSAVGAQFTWAFSASPNVQISVDGAPIENGMVTGTVTDERFVYVLAKFDLLGGGTNETVTATLTVELPGGESADRYVEMTVLSESDPLLDEPLEKQQFSVNLAIDEALRYLYLQQRSDGSWRGGSSGRVEYGATSGFALWAFENVGHLPSNDPDEDIYAATVSAGLEWIISQARLIPAKATPRAVADFGAQTEGVADQNGNGWCVWFNPNSASDPNDITDRFGYQHPIMCSALIASTLPNRVADVLDGSDQLHSMTYRQIVEDAIDWMGGVMSRGGGDSMTTVSQWNGRGGWTYRPNPQGSSSDAQATNRSDMSVNSWYFVACEGAESVFGVELPYWFKREMEYALYFSQQEPGAVGFRYDPVGSNSYMSMATTGGGLSGLRLLETSSYEGHEPGEVMMLPSLGGAGHTITSKRGSALAYLGSNWAAQPSTSYGNGNLGNPYVMWTVARALRLTAAAAEYAGEPVLLKNGGVEFDWERGVDDGSSSINVAGHPREGYFQYLVRTQQRPSSVEDWGRWTHNYYDKPTIVTALYTLVLNPTVFSLPCNITATQAFQGLAPASGTALPAGATVAISGTVNADGPGSEISGVFVDGQPVASLDAAGNFFTNVFVGPGENTYDVLVVQPCGDVQTTITLIGEDGIGVDFDEYQNVSLQVQPQYSNTTWSPAEQVLQVDVTACNTGDTAILGPLVLVFDSFLNAGIELLEPDGYTPEGKPYVLFGSSLSDPDFAAGDCSVARRLRFHSVAGQPLSFNLDWLAPSNRAPYFTSIPDVTEAAGDVYAYHAQAMDPDGQEVLYSPVYGPTGMTVDPDSGLVLWPSNGTDEGSHAIGIRAEDGFGGVATQEFVLTLAGAIANRPPYFTSVPPTHGPVGLALVHQAAGDDPDEDALQFSLLEGPAGMTMTPEGLLEWPLPLPGDHPVGIRLEDGHGGSADQAWVLTVGNQPTNPHAPVLYGSPTTIASLGLPYTYQPIAYDPDDDELVFSLPQHPAGMIIDAQTGFTRWTPTSSAVGQVAVVLQVSDQNGGFASQSWGIDVSETSANHAPVIQSVPPFVGVVGEPYSYDADAVDPNLDPFTFHLVDPPTGMSIDELTGEITWTPNAPGEFVVAIQAIDDQDAAGNQVYTVTVVPPNTPPVITSTPPASTLVGLTWAYSVTANDAESQALAYSLQTAPSGMSIHSQLGYAYWQPTLADAGDHPVEVRVDDGFGGIAVQAFAVTVNLDTVAPTVTLTVEPNPAAVGQPVQICVIASDNVGVTERTLEVDGIPLTLDSTNCGVFVPPAEGSYTIHAEALDASLNLGSADHLLEAAEEPPPAEGEITVHSPEPGDVIRAPTDIVATIAPSQPGATLDWFAQIRAAGDAGPWKRISEGTGAVTYAPIATFDPTMLRNGTWNVQVLSSVDGQPYTGLEFPLEVAGDLKLGNFSLKFVDMVVPLAGIPIVIGREYSSLDTSTGDFGAGWRLTLPGKVEDSAREALNETFYPGTRVNVTTESGRRVGFTATYTPSGWIFPWLGEVGFRPDPGVYETLRTQGSPVAVYIGGKLYSDIFGGVFNPEEYVLKTRENVLYTINEQSGLKLIEDPNGNTITVTESGLISSTGVRVEMERDSQGRITSISQPTEAGSPPETPDLRYEYDSIGNLVHYVDLELAATTFYYESSDFPHYLTRVDDPLGRPGVRCEYDDDGRLEAIVDALGHTTLINSDVGALEEVVFDRLGFPTIRAFNELGFLVSETNALGNTTSFEYDDEGRRTKSTDALGNATSFDHDENGNITRIVDAMGHEMVCTYSSSNRLTSVTDPMGNRSEFAYDAQDNLVAETDALGNTTHHTYNSLGQRVQTEDPLGHVTTMTYDSSGFLESTTDALGNTTSYTMDSYGHILSVAKNRRDSQGIVRAITTEYVRNSKGQILELHDSLGRSQFREWNAAGELAVAENVDGEQVNHTYDALGRKTRSDWPDGTWEEITYDLEGRVLTQRDRDGLTSTWTYDPVGRVLSSTLGTGEATTREYDEVGNIVALENSNGDRTTYTYAPGHRFTTYSQGRRGPQHEYHVATVTTPGGDESVFGTDANGNVTSMTLPTDGEVEVQYDGNNRPIAVISAEGTESQMEYDAAGHPTTWSDPHGRTFHGQYDASGRLIAVQDSLGHTTSYEYDELGNMTTQIDALGRITRWAYDDGGRMTSHTLPLGMSEYFTYGNNGAVSTHTDFMNRVTTYEYDNRRRLTRRVLPDGRQVEITYAPTGERASVVDWRGTTTYAYYPNGRLMSETPPDGPAVEYSWTNEGMMESVTVEGETTTYSYDGQNRLLSILAPDGSQTSYSYGSLAAPLTRTLSNGVVTEYSYDEMPRLTGVQHRLGAEVLADYELTHAPDNSSLTVGELSGRSTLFTFDELHRLVGERLSIAGVEVENTTYAYDEVGNRLSRSSSAESTQYAYDENDRLLTAGDTSFTWSDNGCLLQTSAPGGSWGFEYDSEDRLVLAASPSGASQAYSYDSDGVRISSTSNGVLTRYVVDKENRFHRLLEERSMSWERTVRYVQGLGPVVRQDTNGKRFYLPDGFGSTRQLSDDIGQVTDVYYYDAFGIGTHALGSSDNRLLYSGEERDSVTGFDYLRARYYIPEVGRFSTRDTHPGDRRNPISLNGYVYAHSDPSSFRDPSGHEALGDYLASLKIGPLLATAGIATLAKAGHTLVHGLVAGELSGGLHNPRAVVGVSHFQGYGVFGGAGAVINMEAVWFDGVFEAYFAAGLEIFLDVGVPGPSPYKMHTNLFGGVVYSATQPSQYAGLFLGASTTIGSEVGSVAWSPTAQSITGGRVVDSYPPIPSLFSLSFSITVYEHLGGLDLLNYLGASPPVPAGAMGPLNATGGFPQYPHLPPAY